MRLKVKFGLLALLFLSVWQLTIAQADIPEEYEQVTTNACWTLYLRKDIMAVIVQDNESGEFMASAVLDSSLTKDNARWKGFYQSGVILEYIDGVNPTMKQEDLINSKNNIEYEMHEDGFTAQVHFDTPDIRFEVQVKLDEDGLHVLVPQESIVEGKDQYRIGTLCLFPFLGYSYLGEDGGYMIIPDGQGAIIPLKNNLGCYSSPYEISVYGPKRGVDINTSYKWFKEPENILMPVFGMIHGNKQLGFLGIIEEGDSAATIKAYPNGVVTAYDWIGAQFTYRIVYAQPTINDVDQSGTVSTIMMLTPRRRDFDIRLHFMFCSGKDANYTGLALCYKAYLQKHGAFRSAGDTSRFDMRVDVIGAETENDIFGRRPVKMTTYDQTGEIVSTLLEKGVKNVSVCLRGWQEDGATGGLPVNGYVPHEELGGTTAVRRLLNLCEDKDICLMLEADYASLNLDTHVTMKHQALKRINGDYLDFPTYKKVYEEMNYLLPSVAKECARTTTMQVAEVGIRDISLTGISSLVTDYMDNKIYMDSDDMMAAYMELCEITGEKCNVHLANANAYLWAYAHSLYDMPIADSEYLFTLRSIPFLAIALSGDMPFYAEYINFQANTRRFKLQLIEQGALPSFVLTEEDTVHLVNTNMNNLYSAQFALYEDMVVEWYEELETVYASFLGASIIEHENVGEMTRVRWSNGTTVYLNWSDVESTLDGITVGELSYAVVTDDGE